MLTIRIITLPLLALAIFYLFVLPVLVARDPTKAGLFGILFGIFCFAQLWALIWMYVMQAAAAFYGLKQPRLMLREGSPIAANFSNKPPEGWVVIALMFLSYAFTIYAFGVAYIFISGLDPDAFSTGRNLSFIDGIYFSVITAATGGIW